ncbi:hypothetical protein ACSSS7_003248 [Eimeria intestinalis]
MTSLGTIGHQVHLRPTGTPSLEFASSSETEGIEPDKKGNSAVYRPLRRASESAFFKNFLAVSIASLAVVYLILRCSQHMSFYPKKRAATRSLASGGSGGGVCPNWPGGGGGEDQSGDQDEHQGYNPEGGESSASTPFGGRFPGQRISSPRAWGRRQIPPKWKDRFEHVLGMVEQLATTMTSLLPSVTPEDAVLLGMNLSTLAAVELGTYAYISADLQPSRARAGTAFIDVLQALLEMEETRNAARNMGVESRLSLLRQFHGELAGTPPLTERFRDYRLTMMSWWRAGFFTATQVAAPLKALRLEANYSILPSEKVRAFCRILDAVFRTRKRQLLGSLTMRYWFCDCHRRLGCSLLYTKEEYDEGRKRRSPSPVSPSDEIYHAIVAAGGKIIQLTAPDSQLEYQQSSEKLEESPDSDTGPAHGTSPLLHHHHSGPLPVPSSVPPPPGFGLLHPSSYPSDPRHPRAPVPPQPPMYHSHGLLPRLHPPGPRHPASAVHTPHSPPESDAPLDWEAVGARPRTGAAASGGALEPGWNQRQMPPHWENRMRRDLERMQTAAVACSQVLSSLSPQQAVLLSKQLAMIAALQLGAYAYLPDILQHTRSAVGESYCQLIEQVVSVPQTQQAAAQMKELGALTSLQKLLGVICLPSPPTEVISPEKYQMKMAVQHNTCSFAFRQVLFLLKDLLLAQQSPGAQTTQPEIVLRALQNMYEVLQMQLLSDGALRYPLLAAHKGHKGFGLYSRGDLAKAGKRRKPRLLNVLKQLQEAALGRPLHHPMLLRDQPLLHCLSRCRSGPAWCGRHRLFHLLQDFGQWLLKLTRCLGIRKHPPLFWAHRLGLVGHQPRGTGTPLFSDCLAIHNGHYLGHHHYREAPRRFWELHLSSHAEGLLEVRMANIIMEALAVLGGNWAWLTLPHVCPSGSLLILMTKKTSDS